MRVFKCCCIHYLETSARDQPVKELRLKLKMQPCSRLWLMAVLVTNLCCIVEAAEPQVPAFIVFGDSTVDVGMNNHIATLVKSDFAPYGENFEGGKPTGRFTNGLMVNDFLAIKLGLPMNLPYLDPFAEGERILHGVNFASAASGFLQSTSILLNVLPAFGQLQLFHKYQMKMANLVGHERASSIISEAIFALSAGSNDFILNYLLDPILQQQHTRTEFGSFVLSNQTEFIKQLYRAGARNMLIVGFPPLGCLPAERTLFGAAGQTRCVEDLNEISIEYNRRLVDTISQLQPTLPGARLLYGDVYTYVHEAFYNPSKYGFTEVGRGCCGEGLIAAAVFCNSLSIGTCSDPSTYMFFDSVHPTEKVYKVVADEIYSDMVPFFGLSKS